MLETYCFKNKLTLYWNVFYVVLFSSLFTFNKLLIVRLYLYLMYLINFIYSLYSFFFFQIKYYHLFIINIPFTYSFPRLEVLWHTIWMKPFNKIYYAIRMHR